MHDVQNEEALNSVIEQLASEYPGVERDGIAILLSTFKTIDPANIQEYRELVLTAFEDFIQSEVLEGKPASTPSQSEKPALVNFYSSMDEKELIALNKAMDNEIEKKMVELFIKEFSSGFYPEIDK